MVVISRYWHQVVVHARKSYLKFTAECSRNLRVTGSQIANFRSGPAKILDVTVHLKIVTITARPSPLDNSAQSGPVSLLTYNLSPQAKVEAQEILFNLQSRAKREAKENLVNLSHQAKREAKEILVNLEPRVN